MGLWILVLIVVLIILVATLVASAKSSRQCCRPQSSRRRGCDPVYGEFIRPFTFEPGLPIVQPGGSLIFPVATVQPSHVTYIDDATGGTGLLVPGGTYLVSWTLSPSTGAAVNLLVNGQDPTTFTPPPMPYAQSLTTVPLLDTQALVRAPLPRNNLISLVNGGSSLFTLDSIPNTLIGSTSILTKIRVQRLAPL